VRPAPRWLPPRLPTWGHRASSALALPEGLLSAVSIEGHAQQLATRQEQKLVRAT
jgi:hypothetical protein